MLRQPRHIGDAHGLRPRRCGEVRRRAVPRRGRGHRRSRRLRAHGRAAGGDAAAPWSGTGQRVGQPAQRPSVAHTGGQHRRRPRHLPRSLRRPAGVGHRCARWGGVALGAPADARRGRRSGHGRRGRGGVGPARWCGHADPAGRRQLGRRRRGGRAPSATSPRRGPRRGRRRGRQGAARWGAGGRAPRWECAAGARPARRQPDRLGDGGARAHPDAHRPRAARCRSPGVRRARVLRRAGRRPAGRGPPPGAGRLPVAGGLLRLSRPAELARARRLHRAFAGPRRRGHRRGAGGVGRRGRRRGPGRRRPGHVTGGPRRS